MSNTRQHRHAPRHTTPLGFTTSLSSRDFCQSKLVCTDDAASRKKPPVAQAKAPDSTQLEGQAVSKRARSPRLCSRVRCCLAAWKLTRDSKHDGCLGAQTQIQRLHTSPSDSTVIASGTPQVTTCQVQWRGPTNPQTQIGETKSQ